MWTDLVFSRLFGVKRLREHTIDIFGDNSGKVVLDVGCDTGRNFPSSSGRVGVGGRIIDVDYS